MPKVPESEIKQRNALIGGLDEQFSLWRPHYQELAQFILPRRYVWLAQQTSHGAAATESGGALGHGAVPTTANVRSNRIIDGAGTEAARTLAHGLMAGVTSPSRPWFKLRLANFPETEEGYPIEIERWLEDTTERILTVMAESNFYNALGVQYIDLTIFGSAAMLIYEDFDEVIRCYNSPVGEFRLIQDNRRVVEGMTRSFHMKVHQIVSEFGLENCSEHVQQAHKRGGASLLQTFLIHHLIERNVGGEGSMRLSRQFRYRELYWEAGKSDGSVLRLAGYREKAHIATRWELIGNDTYGSAPAMDALPDIKQLQLEAKQKAQALDKMIRPPVVADIALSHNPTAFLPGGISYVPSVSGFGAKAVYTVNPPLGEMSNDINRLHESIRRYFYNNLFRNVSNLDTVRSAAEIYERKAEDMVILGPVLERFENEALDPAINRVFKIMERKELLLPAPPELADATLEIQYVSMLADAQRNVGSASTERAWQTIGNIGAIRPEVLDIPDWDESIRHYFKQVGVPAKTINSRKVTEELRQKREDQLAAQQAGIAGRELTQGAKNLSETELGAGNTALDALLQ